LEGTDGSGWALASSVSAHGPVVYLRGSRLRPVVLGNLGGYRKGRLEAAGIRDSTLRALGFGSLRCQGGGGGACYN
jgi:hypothetical protein